MAKNLTLRAPALRLAALQWGETSPRKVLAVHGWMDNAASFAGAAPLVDSHVVAVDLPGHGRSAHRPRGAHYHFIDYIGDVLAAADALGWNKFHLLGHSLGAGVCAIAAAAAPGRVRSLALVEGVGPFTAAPNADIAAQLAGAVHRRAAAEAGRQKPPRCYAAVEDAVRARLAAGDMERASAALLVRRNLKRCAGGFCWRTDKRLLLPSAVYLAESQVRNFLGRISCPALLILGRRSTVLPPVVRRRRRLIADLRTVRLDGGHHVHLDDAPAAAEVLRRFYRALR